MPKITWTNCADAMPPDDDREIVIQRVVDDPAIFALKGELISTPANEIWFDIDENKLDHWQWVPYTPEAWKELNK